MRNSSSSFLSKETYQLIYASKTMPGTSMESYLEILRKSRRNNTRNGITGMLAFGDGCFLQILEGDRRIVWQTFARISRDTRHRDIEMIDFAATPERIFGEWSMQSISIRQQLLKTLEFEDTFRPHNWSARKCVLFAIRYSLLSRLAVTGEGNMNTAAPVRLKAEAVTAAVSGATV
ncbi:MAG: BLUF domain-containing protein [Planctomycetota bacterium]